MKIQTFTFNDFAENTYILYDETKECIIIDPGCYTIEEQNILTSFIHQKHLIPTKVLNTHCHIDHILGNKFVLYVVLLLILFLLLRIFWKIGRR